MVTVAVLSELEVFALTERVRVELPDDPDVLLTVSHEALLLAVQLTLDETVMEEDVCDENVGAHLDMLVVIDARNWFTVIVLEMPNVVFFTVTEPVLASVAEGKEIVDMINESFPDPEVLFIFIHAEPDSTTQLPFEDTEMVFSAAEYPACHDVVETLRVYASCTTETFSYLL